MEEPLEFELEPHDPESKGRNIGEFELIDEVIETQYKRWVLEW